jgi:hypothetical protein
MKLNILLALLLVYAISGLSQTVGTRVTFADAAGTKRTGVITEITNGKYKIKYDGVDFSAWADRNQFTIDGTTTGDAANGNDNTRRSSSATTTGSFKVGDHVEVLDRIGMWLPAEILDTKDGQYYIHFTGYTGDYYNTWVGTDKIRSKGSNKSTSAATNKTVKLPEMNGGIPKLKGTAWWLLSIHTKGTKPSRTFTHYPYLFLANGRWEMQFPGNAQMGTYTISGNKLIQVSDGADKLKETYTISWNAADGYLVLTSGDTVMWLQYNTKTTR